MSKKTVLSTSSPNGAPSKVRSLVCANNKHFATKNKINLLFIVQILVYSKFL